MASEGVPRVMVGGDGWKVELVRAIQDQAENVVRLFDRSKGEPLVTVVVRLPWLDDGDIVVSMDDLDAVQRSIERLKDPRLVVL